EGRFEEGQGGKTMSQDVLHDFDTLMKQRSDAAPETRVRDLPPAIGHNKPPTTLPKAMLVVFSGLMCAMLVALSLPAMGAAPMGIVFAICVICAAGYFGGGLLSPIGREADEYQQGARIAIPDGSLPVREAAWQVLLLPALLASFGVYAMALKAMVF
ncbi:MAG: hypothetical protein WA906_09895, partial [Pacificimonas sp.]